MNIQVESPLSEHYIKYRSEQDENGGNDNMFRYAGRVLEYADSQHSSRLSFGAVGFKSATDRIELLGDDA